tara:strand:- start:1281 stop:1667 length:387 start_codon:yes stop_codon:yes gene_type:complete
MNKIILYVSIALNGTLLMILFGIIPFFLYLSILANLGLAWFIKKVLERDNDFEEEVVEIVSKVENFSEHIESVHELEMYYGDENLRSLIEHSAELVNDFIDFQESFYNVEIEPEPELEDDEEAHEKEE